MDDGNGGRVKPAQVYPRWNVALLPFALMLVQTWPVLAQESKAATVQPGQALDPASDPSFDAALPPLDGIAAPPVPEVPAAAPTNDPALTAPLPPLAGFDPTPATSTTIVPSADDTHIRYAVTLEGLDKIGLADEFRAFSALESGKKRAANTTQVSARADEDVALAERLMRGQGYYDGIASSTALPVPGQPGQVLVTISATPGPLYTFGTIAITGTDADPAAIARKALLLEVGKPIVADKVEGGEANIALTLPEQGYPFAKVGQRDILLDQAAHSGDYTLSIAAGPKSS